MDSKRGKIGVGIITCNRPEYLVNSIKSLPSQYEGKIDQLVIINDGKPLSSTDIIGYGTVLQNETNLGVGKSKNRAMQYLLDNGCD